MITATTEAVGGAFTILTALTVLPAAGAVLVLLGAEQRVEVVRAVGLAVSVFTAGLAGYWQLDQERADEIREYLLRGGFLFFDSFFDSNSWYGFEQGMKMIFPNRPIIALTDDHPVFHTVFDLPGMTKVQIPNMNSLMGGGGGWLGDGYRPQWLGVEDDDGRLMVLIAFNNDVADSWQWADDPRYPGELANLGLRIGVNIAMYTMTH